MEFTAYYKNKKVYEDNSLKRLIIHLQREHHLVPMGEMNNVEVVWRKDPHRKYNCYELEEYLNYTYGPMNASYSVRHSSATKKVTANFNFESLKRGEKVVVASTTTKSLEEHLKEFKFSGLHKEPGRTINDHINFTLENGKVFLEATLRVKQGKFEVSMDPAYCDIKFPHTNDVARKICRTYTGTPSKICTDLVNTINEEFAKSDKNWYGLLRR